MIGRKVAFVFCATFFSAGLGSQALADPTYIEFDAMGSHNTESLNNNLNKSGAMTGFYFDDQFHKWGYLRFKDGRIVGVGGDGDEPRALNSKTMITGISGRSGFISDKNGNMTLFDVPGTDGTGYGTIPVAIDNHGDVAGFWGTDTSPAHGFVRDSKGKFTALDAPDGGSLIGSGTLVQSMTPSGVIAGYFIDKDFNHHGFLRSLDGKITTIDVDGAHGTEIYAVSDSNGVAGLYFNRKGVHRGFVIDAKGNFAKFDFPNQTSIDVKGMNKYNDVVGSWGDKTDRHGYVRSGTTGKITTFDAPGAINTIAESINDRGVIAGWYGDGVNSAHGFLRIP